MNNNQKSTIWVECENCEGKGYVKCEDCGGDGKTFWPGYEGKTFTCIKCKGKGTEECPECHGLGEVKVEK